MEIIFKFCVVLQTVCLLCHSFPDTGEVNVPTRSRKLPKKTNCCQNNGICILGTFCRCKKNYFGRYCEHKVDFKPCGPVLHGAWIQADCDLCKCFDGKMSCIPRIYDGCDDEGLLLQKATTKNPLKAKTIRVLGNDRDYQDIQQEESNFEDYYYTDEENTSSHFKSRWSTIVLASTFAILVLR